MPYNGKDYNPYGNDSPTLTKATEMSSEHDDQPYQAFPRGVVDLRNEAAARHRGRADTSYEYDSEVASPGEEKKSLLDMDPETTIGETLEIKGTLRFERLLRLDGIFEGELLSTGDLIVGPRGEVRGDVKAIRDLLVYGKVIGNIAVDSLDLCGDASVYGDITCKSCRIDPTVVLVGRLNISPYAPQLMRPDGSIAPEPDDFRGPAVDRVEDAMMRDDASLPGHESPVNPIVAAQEPDKFEEDPGTPQGPAEPMHADAPASSPNVAIADGIGEIPYDEPIDEAANDAERQHSDEPPADNADKKAEEPPVEAGDAPTPPSDEPASNPSSDGDAHQQGDASDPVQPPTS